MNVALLQKLHATPALELAGELQGACGALPGAATTIYGRVTDKDRAALDMLERLAERAEGIRRLAMRTREALKREAEPQQAA